MTEYEIEIGANTLINTGSRIESLLDVIARPEKFYLWAVNWYIKGPGTDYHNGISFHCRYSDASSYKEAHNSPIQAFSKTELVPVSEWLYLKVSETGDFWTELRYMSQALTYEGPTLN